MDSLTFSVTQEHIDKGVACKSSLCPVALALFDESCTDVTVDETCISFISSDVFYSCEELPTDLSNFIYLTDSSMVVRPATFTILVESDLWSV